MKIRVLGAGWYGAHLASALIADGHAVEVHEIADKIFSGASGGNPARLHKGFHYPRSRLTRAACQDHADRFEATYGHLTSGIAVNLYAVAANDSLMDFGTYCQVLRGEVEFIVVKPEEFGLRNVEGAVLTGERHIVIDRARRHFEAALKDRVHFGVKHDEVNDPAWDLTIDCTFCSYDAENIDRFEPCVTVILRGDPHKAVTIMDGPFGSVYPWNESRRMLSLTSASLTPISKTCRTYAEARAILDKQTESDLKRRAWAMLRQMEHFWPGVIDYEIWDFKRSIRAMPRSAADARLVDVVRVGDRAVRVRAGKIDAIFHAEKVIKEMIATMQQRKAA